MPTYARNVCANNLSIYTRIRSIIIGAISNDLEQTLTLFQGQAVLWR